MSEKIAYVLLITAMVFTTLAYGGVHQPVIAVYYVMVTISGLIVAIASFGSAGKFPTRETLQIPIFFAAIYAFVQIVPFGSATPATEIENIPWTISLDPFSTFVSALNFTAALIFFSLLLYCIDSARRVRRLVVFLTVFGFGFAFFAVLQSVLSPDKIYGIYEVASGSQFGSFVNRNNFAAYIVMIMALPIALFFSGSLRKDQWLLSLTGIILMGIALLLSDSRGGLVAFGCQLLLIAAMTRERNSRRDLFLRTGLIVLLIAAIVGGSVFVGGDTTLDRIADTAASEDITTSRSHIWSVTVSVIAANLPFGAGFGAFGVAYPQFDPSSGMLRVEQAHNDYLQLLADAGIPGLLLGGWFLVLFVRKGMNSLRIENKFRRGIAIGAFAGCFAVLVHSLFDFVLHITAVALLFLVLLALLCRCQGSFADDLIETKRIRRRHNGSNEFGPGDEPIKGQEN